MLPVKKIILWWVWIVAVAVLCSDFAINNCHFGIGGDKSGGIPRARKDDGWHGCCGRYLKKNMKDHKTDLFNQKNQFYKF